jgi:hypothetical protein
VLARPLAWFVGRDILETTGDILVQDTGDRGLIGKPLFKCPALKRLQIPAGDADIDLLVFLERCFCRSSKVSPAVIVQVRFEVPGFLCFKQLLLFRI